MDPGFALETARLRLRPYRPDDLDDLHAMLSDTEHMRFYPAPLDRAGARTWLERQLERYRVDGFGQWIAEDRTDGGFVGTVGPMFQEVEGERHVEIGWHVRPGLKGLGYAPEAGAAARDWAFGELGEDHVISLILARNTPSVRVAEKLGMHVWRVAEHAGLWHRVYRVDRVLDSTERRRKTTTAPPSPRFLV